MTPARSQTSIPGHIGGMNFRHERESFDWIPHVPLLHSFCGLLFIQSPFSMSDAKDFKFPASEQSFDIVNLCFIKVDFVFLVYQKLNAFNFCNSIII
jgi:hypothetical protein